MLLKVSQSSLSWAPGMPKTTSVPSACRAATTASAPVILPVTQTPGPGAGGGGAGPSARASPRGRAASTPAAARALRTSRRVT